MGRPFRRVQIHGVVWTAICMAAGLMACSNSSEPKVPEVFIQVNQSMVTVDAYLREVDEAVADYLADKDSDKEVMANIRLGVLNQITERLIVFERAKELGIQVDDQELEALVASIKADYPKGEFEQVLLEQAVSYPEWKNDMRAHLLMQKVIDQELEPKIQITSEELSAFYEKHYTSSGAETNEASDTAGRVILIAQQSFDLFRAFVLHAVQDCVGCLLR